MPERTAKDIIDEYRNTMAYKGLKKLWKEATKNNIPSDPQKIIEMKDRLEAEEELKGEAVKAKLRIKEIIRQRKDAYKEVKRERRRKIKAVFRKLVGK